MENFKILEKRFLKPRFERWGAVVFRVSDLRVWWERSRGVLGERPSLTHFLVLCVLSGPFKCVLAPTHTHPHTLNAYCARHYAHTLRRACPAQNLASHSLAEEVRWLWDGTWAEGRVELEGV